MDTTDIVEKLIQLAIKNPNREESAAAALKAVQLIDKFNLPIGAHLSIRLDEEKPWKPPEPEFVDFVDNILNNRRQSEQTAGPGTTASASSDGALRVQDRDVETAKDAWRTRMVDAWRAIREERRNLKAEVYRYEQTTRQHYRWTDPRNQDG